MLLKLSESGIYDIDDFFLFKEKPFKPEYFNSVYNIERVDLQADEITLQRKLINF